MTMPSADFDGTNAGLLERCPMCLRTIPYGAGVTRMWHRFHYWCAITVGTHEQGETRLASGAMV